MTENRRRITFHASKIVSEWYEQLSPRDGTHLINGYLENTIQEKQFEKETLDIVERDLGQFIVNQSDERHTITSILKILDHFIKIQHRQFEISKYEIGSEKRTQIEREISHDYDQLRASLVIAHANHQNFDFSPHIEIPQEWAQEGKI